MRCPRTLEKTIGVDYEPQESCFILRLRLKRTKLFADWLSRILMTDFLYFNSRFPPTVPATRISHPYGAD